MTKNIEIKKTKNSYSFCVGLYLLHLLKWHNLQLVEGSQYLVEAEGPKLSKMRK
jgi:hypothetical protein